MATITPLRPNGILSPPRLLVLEPKTTSGLQSPEGKQLAEVTESILLVLNKCHEYLEYLKNTDQPDYNPVPPKRSERITMRAQFKGRRKPLPYILDEE
jgi:hypothetical protein